MADNPRAAEWSKECYYVVKRQMYIDSGPSSVVDALHVREELKPMLIAVLQQEK